MPVYKQNTKKTTVSFKAAWTYCIYVNSIDSFTNNESNAVVFLIFKLNFLELGDVESVFTQ